MGETGKKDRAKSGKKSAGPNLIQKAKEFCKGVKAEFKKIIWPSRETFGKQTAAVLIISVVLGGFIRLYDIVCQYVISFIK